jgi:hypothetical protein
MVIPGSRRTGTLRLGFRLPAGGPRNLAGAGHGDGLHLHPAGHFVMGSEAVEPGRQADEGCSLGFRLLREAG